MKTLLELAGVCSGAIGVCFVIAMPFIFVGCFVYFAMGGS